MTIDTNKILAGLDKACTTLETAANDINNVIQIVAADRGQAGQVLPVNLQKAIDTLKNLVDGEDQSSLNSLKDFVLDLKIRDITEGDSTVKFDSKPKANPSVMQQPDEPAIDTTPDLSKGAQSRIIKESNASPLSKYIKAEYAALDRMQESVRPDEFTVDSVMDEMPFEDFDDDFDYGSEDDDEFDTFDRMADDFEQESIYGDDYDDGDDNYFGLKNDDSWKSSISMNDVYSDDGWR